MARASTSKASGKKEEQLGNCEVPPAPDLTLDDGIDPLRA